jgi:AMP nucleosidase
VWEHDEDFRAYLVKIRTIAIDMETATLFSAGFANHIPTGALLLVSDMPLKVNGIKTAESDKKVTEQYVTEHLNIGIKSLKSIMNNSKTIKHLRFE